MRNFAYKNPDYIKNEVVPELVEEHPCYQQSVYDSVMYDESPDGDLIQVDMTQILLNQEKYRRLLGDMNVQNILAQMHPTQSTVMDNMTDEQLISLCLDRGIDSSTFGTLQNDVDSLLADARSVVDTPIEPAIPSTDTDTTDSKDL